MFLSEYHLALQPPLIPAQDISQLSKEADPFLLASLLSPFSTLYNLVQGPKSLVSPALRGLSSDPALRPRGPWPTARPLLRPLLHRL